MIRLKQAEDFCLVVVLDVSAVLSEKKTKCLGAEVVQIKIQMCP